LFDKLKPKFEIEPFLISFFSIIAANQDWAAQEQTVRLINLQLERERLRKRQQEIKSHVIVKNIFILYSCLRHQNVKVLNFSFVLFVSRWAKIHFCQASPIIRGRNRAIAV
jgi:hypothetical protein